MVTSKDWMNIIIIELVLATVGSLMRRGQSLQSEYKWRQ